MSTRAGSQLGEVPVSQHQWEAELRWKGGGASGVNKTLPDATPKRKPTYSTRLRPRGGKGSRAAEAEPSAHLPQHHDDAVGVQEARGVPLVQAHLRLHGRPGSAAKVVLLRLRAGGLQDSSEELGPDWLSLLSLSKASVKRVLFSRGTCLVSVFPHLG